ncbi:MAG: radical SAM protein [Candidatus Ancaeobacter aquaticus]|nr:radical SAM protein [Candidatus Ancaeobacter aquaticus]
MKILSAPKKVSLEITNLCNLNCKHCNVADTKNAPGDLTTEEWKNFIDECARLKVFRFIMSGGEPFMRPDIRELIDHIFSYHFRLHINTNGTLIDKYMANYLSRYKRIETVQVSIDGSCPETHEKIRPAGSFDKATRGIKNLLEHNVPTITFSCITTHNIDDMENIIKLGKKLGVHSCNFTSFLPVGYCRNHINTLIISPKQEQELLETVKSLKEKYGNYISGPLINEESFMRTFKEYSVKNYDPEKCYMTSCNGGIEDCSVRPDGWVIPCSRLWEYKTGNIKEQSLYDIWHNSKEMNELRSRREKKINNMPECHKCEYMPLCRGGCPAIPFDYEKGITGWDPTSCYKVHTGEKESYITKSKTRDNRLIRNSPRR